MGFFIMGFAIGFMVLWVIGFIFMDFSCIMVAFLCIMVPFLCMAIDFFIMALLDMGLLMVGFFIMGLCMVEVWAKTGTTRVATAATATRLVINFME